MIAVNASHPFANGAVSLTDLKNAGNAITGGYTGNSLTLLILIVFFPGLSIYNAIELLVLIFFTFNKYQGLYFWSLIIASTAIIPYSLGFLLKFGDISKWLGVALLTVGWWGMVTGQSVVLWSRLHLILEGNRGRRTLQWTKWMIIIDAFILHLPTTVLTFGSNGDIDTHRFAYGYSIMEKIQMSGFFVQEVILSSIYIIATSKILKNSLREHTKKLMWQLLGINVIIIIMDLGLLGLEAASLYLLETLVKSVIYSIKLKLEFAILGQLVQFVGRPGTNVANDERTRRASEAYFGSEKTSRDTLRPSEASASGFGPGFISDFAELSKSRAYITQTMSARSDPDAILPVPDECAHRTRAESIRLPPGMTMDDVNVAMFQHTEDLSLRGNDADADIVAADSTLPGTSLESSTTGSVAV